ncbi:hypothetical protein K4K61_002174 [Colletotrichum sp. SAR11_59]|nr:hypothetical protein K4K61_002174 [Colletotrichum sp. SAR11_59]
MVLCAMDSTNYSQHLGFNSLHCLPELYSVSGGNRYQHHASIGAFITLVAFASGPFFQQTVTSELRSVIDPAFSPSANAAAAYSWGEGVSFGSYTQFAFQELPYNMTAAIFAGLFAPDQSSPPKPPSNCPTGNCTWDSFGTLSVNTKCIDLSSLVKRRQAGTEYYLEAPDDPSLQSMFGQTNRSDQYHLFHIESYMPAGMNMSHAQPFLNLTATMVIVDWVKVWPNNSAVMYELLGKDSLLEAFRCAIYFSAKEALPRVENGVYSEEVLQEVTQPENVEFLNERNDSLRHFVRYEDPWRNLAFRLPVLSQNRRNNFIVPRTAFYDIYSQMKSDLTGTVSIASRQYSGTTTPLLVYKADSVVQSIQNMADAITTEMRRNGSSVNPEQTIQGHVWIQQQFVVVRWAWLALPATMLVLTSLFLAATIVETRRKDAGVWLSSPLALFFNAHMDSSGKDVLSHASSKSLNTADGMIQVAAGLKASIDKGSRTINVIAKEPAKAQNHLELRSLRSFNPGDSTMCDVHTRR